MRNKIKQGLLLTSGILATTALGVTQTAHADELTASRPLGPVDSSQTRTQTEVTEQQVNDAKTAADTATAQANEAKSQLDTATSANNQAQSDLATAQSDLQTATENAANATADNINQTKQTITDLQGQESDAKSAVETAQTDVDNAQKAYDQASANPDLKAVDEAQATVDTATANQSQANTQVDNLTNQVNDAKSAVETATTAEAQAEKVVTEAKAQRQTIIDANTDKQAKIADTNSAIAKSTSELNQLNADKTTAKNESAELQKQADDTSAVITDLQGKIASQDKGADMLITPAFYDAIMNNTPVPYDSHRHDGDYVPSDYDDHRIVDPMNLTDDELRELSAFAVETINTYREEAGLTDKFVVTEDSLDFAKKYAAIVRKNFPNGQDTHVMHDTHVERDMKAAGLNTRLYENISPGAGISTDNDDASDKTTMAKIKTVVDWSISAMMIGDSDPNNGHTKNFLREGSHEFALVVIPQFVETGKYETLYMFNVVYDITGERDHLKLSSRGASYKPASLRPDYTSQLKDAQNKLTSINAQKMTKDLEVSQADDAIKAKQAEIDALKAQLETLMSSSTDLASAEQKVKDAENALAEAQAKRVNAENELKLLKAQLADANAELDKAADKVTEAQSQLEKAKDVAGQAQADKDAKAKELADAKTAYDNAAATLQSIQTRLQSAKDLLASYQNAEQLLADAKAKLAEAEKTAETTSDDLIAKRQAYAEASQLADQAVETYNRLKAQYDAQEIVRDVQQQVKGLDRNQPQATVTHSRMPQVQLAKTKGGYYHWTAGKTSTPTTVAEASEDSHYSRVAKYHSLPATGDKHTVGAMLVGMLMMLAGFVVRKDKKQNN